MSSKIDNTLITQHLFPLLNSSKEKKMAGEELVFQPDKDSTITCYYLEANPDSPVILFFPSATDAGDSFAPHAASFQKLGMSTVYVSYRGYGKNSYTPTFSSTIEDCNYLIEAVIQRLREKNNQNPLFVMGQSLGSVIAIDTTLNNVDFIKGLILDSSICKTREYLTGIGLEPSIVDFDEKDGFNNLEKIENIKIPTIIFHGSKDPLVNVAEAEALQACSGAKSKQFFIIPGGAHGNLPSIGGDTYYETIKNYMNITCGVNTWRQRRRKFKKNK